MVLVALDTYKKRKEMMEAAEGLSKKINNLYILNPSSEELFALSSQLDMLTVQYNMLTDRIYTV